MQAHLQFLIKLHLQSGPSLVSPPTASKGAAERKHAAAQRHAGAATAASKQRRQPGATKAEQNTGTPSITSKVLQSDLTRLKCLHSNLHFTHLHISVYAIVTVFSGL